MKTEPLDRIARHITVFLILLLVAGLLHASPGVEAFEAGDYERAQALLEAETATAPDPRKSLLLGRIAFEASRYEAAFEHLGRAVEGLPEDADAQYWYGSAAGTLAGNVSVFRAAGYARKSRKALERALALDARHVGAHEALAQYYLQAPGFMGGDKDEAEALARRLASFAPVEGQALLATVFRATGREAAAREALAELTRRAPGDPRGWLQFGFALQGDEDYDTAHDAFTRAAALAAESGDAPRELSALYQVARTAVFSEQRVDAGVDAMRRYIATLPETARDLPGIDWAHYRLGQLLTMRGDTQAAEAAFEKALELTNDDDLPGAIRRFKRRS